MARRGKLNEQQARDVIERPARSRKYTYHILIACEDENTEPYYFEKYKQQFEEIWPKETLFLRPIGTGRNSLGVVKRAIDNECLKLQQMLDTKADNLLSVVLSQSDVWEIAETKEISDEVWQTIVDNIKTATVLVEEFRLHEGEILKKDFIHRINLIEENLDKVSVYENERMNTVKERIRKYFADFELSVDENRFEQELIYYLEKFDITEEKVRLRKHIDYFKEILDENENGKKLGFVVQEIGREINTLGSKANHADIQRIVVEMKDELEKIKEQLGNIL